MYRFADRFPVSPSVRLGTSSPAPWGLSRLEPYGSVGVIDEIPAGIDPATQRGVYKLPNGTIVMAPGKHERSRRGVERQTQTHEKRDGSRGVPDTDTKQETVLD
ncbi:putative ATP-grasp-modified RiPP [Kribbella antibiotica]|nr:putative ATP-grasp-modified RiPP [Kribbella antibiotica]